MASAQGNDPSMRRSMPNRSTLVALLGLAGLIVLILTSLLNIARIGYTYLVVYPVTVQSIGDPEPVRWAASNYGITHLVKFANQTLPPEARIFSFRQSDVAYYAKNPIAVYTDNSYAQMFQQPSATALKQALLKEGIRYIAIPPYGMAEVNNSAFGDLIADPSLALLIFEQGGERLFDLASPSSRESSVKPVRVFDIRSKQERDKWNSALMPQPLTAAIRTSPASIEKSSDGVTIRRNRPMVASDILEDVLQPWDLTIDATPFVVGRSDFDVRDGLYSFEGRVAGDGLVTLYVDFDTRAVGEPVRRERKLLWSGVLNDEVQDIGGQFKVLLGGDETGGSGAIDRSSRVFFGLKQGGYLTVQALSIQKTVLPENASGLEAKQTEDFLRLQRAYSNGWRNRRPDAKVERYSEPLDVFGMDRRGTIAARQTSGNARMFDSPAYFLPTDFLTLDTAYRMERTSEGVKPVVEVSMNASGNGLLSVSLTGTCLGASPAPKQNVLEQEGEEKEEEEPQGVIAGDVSDLEPAEQDQDDRYTKFVTPMTPVSLRREGRTYRETVVLDCAPSSVRATFGISGDRLKSPSDMRMGEARISDFDMSLKAWAGGQEIADIALIKSTDVRQPRISPPQTQLPDYGQ
jgi:hypothetical protein